MVETVCISARCRCNINGEGIRLLGGVAGSAGVGRVVNTIVEEDEGASAIKPGFLK